MGVDPGTEGGNIIIRLILDAAEYIRGLQDAREQAVAAGEDTRTAFDRAFEGASQNVKFFGQILQQTMEQTGASINEAFRSVKDGLGVLGQIPKDQLPDLEDAFKRLGGTVKGTGFEMGSLLKAAGRLVGITSIVALITKAFASLRRVLKESIDQFQEYSFEVFRLDVAVRAAQRRQGEAIGTTEEWRESIQRLREQFQIFSTKDLTAATSKIVLLTRELGFTKEQTEQVVQASIVLAEITGVKVEEAARRLTLFLDTGYSRGLALLGLQVNRTTVEQQALAEGLDRTWNEMTRQTRAALGLNAVMEQVAPLLEDAGKAARTFQGRLMALQATQSDLSLEIGQNLQSFRLLGESIETIVLQKFVKPVSDGLNIVLGLVFLRLGKLVGGILGALATLRAAAEQFKEEGLRGAGDALKSFSNNVDEATRQIQETLFQQFMPALENLGDVSAEELGAMLQAFEEADKEMEDIVEAMARTINKLEDEFIRFGQAQDDAWRRYQQNLEDIQTDFNRDIIDAHEDLTRKLEDIDTKSARKRDKLILDSARKERDIRNSAQEDIAQAQIRFRFEEIREQRRFNLRMAQLQREFLLNLEDAVRERDARQVLMLIRRHNLQTQSAQENFDEQRRIAAEELKLEIQTIQRRTQIRIQAERAALRQRIADEEAARKQRIADAKADLAQEIEDIKLARLRDEEDAKLAYNRRLADLEEYHKRRLEAIGRELAREVGANVAAAQAIINAWANAQQQMELRQSFWAGFISQAGAAVPSQQPLTPGGRTPFMGGGVVFGFQHGGQMIARKPTLAMFGEAGPELGSFVPLNRAGQMGGGVPGGRIGLDVTIRAEAGFMAEVAESVMQDVADVIVETERVQGSERSR